MSIYIDTGFGKFKVLEDTGLIGVNNKIKTGLPINVESPYEISPVPMNIIIGEQTKYVIKDRG